ncbi:hypothetical protein, partial [Paenibacillus gansuensis]
MRGKRYVTILNRVLIIFLLHSLVLGVTPAWAAVEHAQVRRVALVAVPDLSFEELDESDAGLLPNLHKLIQNGALGAMNIRTPIRGESNSYLTFGAGAPAAAPFVEASETVLTLKGQYAVQVGETRKEMQGIVVPEVAKLIAENEKRHNNAEAGLLGELLAQAGVGRYVFGNRDVLPADEPGNLHLKRQTAYLLMDRSGRIPFGEIGGPATVQDPDHALTVMTNYALLLQSWNRLPEDRPLAVLYELGDLDRLYTNQSFYTAEKFEKARRLTLQRIDYLLGKLAERLGPRDRLVVFSPTVNPDAAGRKSLMGPLVVYDGGRQTWKGRLSSPTTRQPGLTANVDLAPTILEWFGIAPPETMSGRAMGAERMGGESSESGKTDKIGKIRESGNTDNPEGDVLPWLLEELRQMQTVYKLRPDLLYSFVTYEVLVLAGSLLALLYRWKRSYAWLRVLLLSLLAAPIVLLAMGWLAALSAPWLVVVFVAGSLGLGLWTSSMRTGTAVLLLALAVSELILADGLTGFSAMERSVLGYDPMIGARYYGVGNEFEGVLIGAVILAASAVLQQMQRRQGAEPSAPAVEAPRGRARKQRGAQGAGGPGTRRERAYRLGAAAAFALTAAFLAAPTLGADAGGALA